MSGPLIVRAGNGGDALTVGSAANSMDTIQGPVTLDGDAGTDAVTFLDAATPTGKAYTLLAGSLSRTGAATVLFGTLESLFLVSVAGEAFATVP